MDVKEMLTAYAAANGVTMAFDENGACTLPLDGERALHLQFRDGTDELDLLALLGTVPEVSRAFVFERLLAANYYWEETLGATLSWRGELEQVVLAYPIRTDTTDEATLYATLERFIDLQAAWAERLQYTIIEAETALALDNATADLSDLEPLPDESDGAANNEAFSYGMMSKEVALWP